MIQLPVATILVATLLAAPPSYDVDRFELPGSVSMIVPAHLDGDGRRELVAVSPGRLTVHRQTDQGFALPGSESSGPDLPPVELALPGPSVGWDIVDVDGNGIFEVVALLEGKRAHAWSFDPESGSFGAPQVLQTSLEALVPGGFYRLSFARDVDGDGDADLVIPRNEAFDLHLRQADGSYLRGPSVSARRNVRQHLETAGNLRKRVGQSLSLPLFSIRDVNGDGRVDLSSRTESRLDVYLATGDGRLPSAPTYSFDIAAERAKLGPAHGDDFDTSNITSPLTKMVQVVTPDVNGDGIEDLVVRAGGRVDLYLGTLTGMDTSTIHQRLKASGNVVGIAVEDEDGDGQPDLWIFRIETISLASALVWFVTPGSIDFDGLIYRFDGEKFSKRPSRRIEVKLKFPALTSFMNQLDEISVEVEKRSQVPAAAADLTGAGQKRDVVSIEEGSLRGYLGRLEPADNVLPRNQEIFVSLLELTQYRPDKDDYVIELDRLADFVPSPGGQLLEEAGKAPPEVELPLPGSPRQPSPFLMDLNGDGRDDVIVLYDVGPSGVTGAIVLSR